MLVSMFGFGDAIRPPAVILDPSRVAAQIVSGIGFLGAGVIIFRRAIIRGLTTAASIWVVAAIGMAIGGGLYWGAGAGAVLALGILAVMKPVERRLVAARRPALLQLVVDRRRISSAELMEWLRASGVAPLRIDARAGSEAAKTRIDLTFAPRDARRLIDLVPRVADLPGVREAKSSADVTFARPAADNVRATAPTQASEDRDSRDTTHTRTP
jgi:putative Mg2+ transporter-C (MgtC) family protein